MKECPSCKTKNRNDAVFCTECGASLKDVPAADQWAAAAGDFLNKAKETAAVGAKKVKDAAAAGAEKARQAMDDAEKRKEAERAQGVSSGGWDTAVEFQTGTAAPAPQKGMAAILVDQSENVVSTIGSNYLQNFLLNGGSVKKGYGILSEKRFYFNGKSFGKGFSFSETKQGVVSIDDITFTEFAQVRSTGLLIWGILFTLTLVLSPVGIFCLVRYFLSKQSTFTVSFAGGQFTFDVTYYPIQEFQDFQRQLHLLKDHIKEA